MSPGEIARNGARTIIQPTGWIELVTHATVIMTVVICATILGDHHVLTSGDTLAVFTTAITGTAAVAASRSGNRRTRADDSDTNGTP